MFAFPKEQRQPEWGVGGRLQVRILLPSHHQVEGMTLPMEIQFVHGSPITSSSWTPSNSFLRFCHHAWKTYLAPALRLACAEILLVQLLMYPYCSTPCDVVFGGQVGASDAKAETE